MAGAKTDIVDTPIEHAAIGTDVMLVEEIENSSTIKQPNMVMNNIDMDVISVPEQGTIKEPNTMFLEETSHAFKRSKEVHSRHNKPKKANTHVIPEDYVCTSEDFAIIESIMSAPKNTKFVDIGDSLLSNDDLRCLTRDDAFLPGDVINAYIYCISACDHLRERPGGKVYLDTTFAVAVLKKSEHHRVMKRVHLYLKHDMVLFPINISKTHWYLLVVNAKKRVIQILDSLGDSMGRSDISVMLQGLEKHLKIASQMKDFDKGDRWMDLDVTTWPDRKSVV